MLSKFLTQKMKDWLYQFIPEDYHASAERLIQAAGEMGEDISFIELKQKLKDDIWVKIKEAMLYAALGSILLTLTILVNCCCRCVSKNCRSSTKRKKECKPTIVRFRHERLRPFAEKMMEMEAVTVLE